MRAAEEAAADAVRESVREGVAGGVRDGVRGGVRDGVRGGTPRGHAFRILDPRRSYAGRIGEGGATVRLAAMNGSILLLASGSRPEDARPVVLERQSFAVTIPKVVVRTREVKVRVPQVSVVPPVPPAAPRAPAPEPAVEVPAQTGVHAFAHEAPVVRGNIAGDFLSTSGTSSYRLGDVSGRVWILTHAGEIVVG